MSSHQEASLRTLIPMLSNPTNDNQKGFQSIDHVPPNVSPPSQLPTNVCNCVFDDSEAVLKMIIKGSSPNMRHVSRTHRVDEDWFLDRKIWYVNTKEQIADILTKGVFYRFPAERMDATHSHHFQITQS